MSAIFENKYWGLFVYFINNYLLETLEHLLLVVVVYALLCIVMYNLMQRRLGIVLVNSTTMPKCRRVLVITAHPDDECMFFGPTILSLTRQKNVTVYLLCLSTGDFDNEGSRRRVELWKACRLLNIKDENITLINATTLQDNPNIKWKMETIAKFVLKEVETLDINLVVTFDRNGVSQHPNHCAIYYAVASLCYSGLLPERCKILTLDSINLFRKYASIFDLLISFGLSTKWCVLNWSDRKVIQSAMKQHKSQLKWFRYLYIHFSRYMLINSLHEMNLSDIELEMQLND